MLANAVAAVVFLLIGGILAVGVVTLTRWPLRSTGRGRHLLQGAHRARHRHADLLDHLLRDRGAVLLLVDAAALPIGDPEDAWLAFALMVIGAIVNNVAVYQGSSSRDDDVVRADDGAPSFYPDLILFAVGALIGCFVLPRHAGRRQARQRPTRARCRW